MNTKEIILHGKYGAGKVTLVDDDDYELFNKYKWYAVIKGKDTKRLYVARYSYFDGKNHTYYIHREIMGNPLGLEVDHINHEGLDNQKENLRICTHQENIFNKSKEKYGSSQYKGVSFSKNTQKWVARIRINGCYKSLGYYLSEIEAAEAYNVAALERDNVFYCINAINQEDLRNALQYSDSNKVRRTKYRGIAFHRNRWCSTVWDKVNKKSIYLGRFHTEEEAYLCQQEYLGRQSITVRIKEEQ